MDSMHLLKSKLHSKRFYFSPQRHQNPPDFPSLEINFWLPSFFLLLQLAVGSMGLALAAFTCGTPNRTLNFQLKLHELKACESPAKESCPPPPQPCASLGLEIQCLPSDQPPFASLLLE